MKKKLLSMILAAAMTVSLFSVPAMADDADGEGKFVAITVPSIGNDFMVAVTEAMKEALEEQGCTVQLDSAEGDVTTQTNQIENDAQMGADAIVVWPINAASLTNTIKNVTDQGIQVLAFANAIDGATASTVSAEDGEMGYAEAEMANDWIDATFPDAGDGEIKIFVISSSAQPEAVDRSEGIAKIAELNSKVDVINGEVDWNDPNLARQLVENTLLSNPDIKMILAPNGTVAVAANSYVMSANSPVEDKEHFAIFGVDETAEIDDAIRASANNESVLRGTISMGSIADTVHDFMICMTPFIEGGTMETKNGDSFAVTPETLE